MRIFELQTAQASVFRTLIEALKEILDDVNIKIIANKFIKDKKGNDKEVGGLKITATNNTDNILVHLHLKASKFEVYKCTKSTMKIGINMSNLFKLIRSMNNSDTLTMFIDDDNRNKLGIIIENKERNSKTEYKLNLIDLADDEIKVPPVKFTSIDRLHSAYFHKICRDMNVIADTIDIKRFSKYMVLSCKGEYATQETTLCESTGNEDDLALKIEKQLDDDEIVQGVYELKNLTLFTKCTSLCPDIQILMKNDYPLVICYDVASLGEILLCLSPVKFRDEDSDDEY
jgi:proliferating cell nuclear antigen